jgi:glycosyltransferase involved in cell wall biosynthesis
MSQAKVSIIVPVYNAEKYLERCYNSINSQSYPNIEVIMVNDGSTDESAAIVDELTSNRGVIGVHQANQGSAAARCAGFLRSTGDYVLFLDSDDTLEPEAIEFLVEKMESQQLDAVYCGFNRVVDGVTHPVASRGYEGTLSGEKMLKLLLDPEFLYIACMCFSRRELWNKEMFVVKREMPSEDILTNIRLVLKCNRVGVYDKRLYNYYQVSTSLTMTGRYFKQALWRKYFSELETTLNEKIHDNRFDDAIKINEIHTFSFYINKIVKDDWYKQVISYEVRQYPRKIRVLHALLHSPSLLHMCVKGNRWMKRLIGRRY